MSVHLDADPLLRAVAHQMLEELARQGAHIDPAIVDSAAAAVLGQAYGDHHAGEIVTRLGQQNPQLAAIFGTAFAFLKSHPGFWVGWYALKHHESPLPHDHPWARHVARAFGESDAHHELHHHGHHHRLPPPPPPVPHPAAPVELHPAAPVTSGWGDYYAAGWGHGHHHHHHHHAQQQPPPDDYGTDTGWRPPPPRPRAPGFGGYGHRPAPPHFAHPYAPPPPQQQYGGQQQPPPPPATDPSQYGQAQPYADPSQYLPQQPPPAAPDPSQYAAPPGNPTTPGTAPAFDPSTMEGMFTPLPAQPGAPPQGPGAPGAPVDGGSTDVSTAGYTVGADPHALRRTINAWIAQLQQMATPSNVTQQQRTFLLQQLFALALSPTPATFAAVWQALQYQGPEAVQYLRALWQLFNPPTYPGAAPQLYPPVVSGWGHPGEIGPSAEGPRPGWGAEHHDEHRQQEELQHREWEREQHGRPGAPAFAHPAAPTWGGRPLPPRGRPLPPHPEPPHAGLNSYARWQHVHPNLSYDDYRGWWAMYGQHGATIEPDAPSFPGQPSAPFAPNLSLSVSAGHRAGPGSRGMRGPVGAAWWGDWGAWAGPAWVVDQRNEGEDALYYDDRVTGPEGPQD